MIPKHSLSLNILHELATEYLSSVNCTTDVATLRVKLAQIDTSRIRTPFIVCQRLMSWETKTPTLRQSKNPDFSSITRGQFRHVGDTELSRLSRPLLESSVRQLKYDLRLNHSIGSSAIVQILTDTQIDLHLFHHFLPTHSRRGQLYKLPTVCYCFSYS